MYPLEDIDHYPHPPPTVTLMPWMWMPFVFSQLSEQSTCITISASFATRLDAELTNIPIPEPSQRLTLPPLLPPPLLTSLLFPRLPLLNYARKLQISEKEAIASLGIVYRELNQDGTKAESGSIEEVVAHVDF